MNQTSRSMMDSLRGGLHPREVSAAVALGLLAGFLTGGNLCFAAALVAALAFNVSWRVFGQCWLVGCCLSLAATPMCLAVGRWMFERGRLASALAPIHDHPLFVLSDLDRYVVLGGLICGLLVAVPAAALAAKLAANVQGRGKALSIVTDSPATSMLRLHLRAANWLLCGGALQPIPATSPRWLRRGGLLMTAICVLPTGAFAYFMAPRWTQDAVLHSLAEANGAQVDAANVRLSWSTGKLEIHDLQVADPEHLDRDRLRVGYVAAQVRPGPLLRGRIHIERLLMEEVNGDTARQSRANAFGLDLPDFDRLASDAEPATAVDDDGARPLQDCVNDWAGVQMRLERVQQLLATIEDFSGLEPKDEPQHPGRHALPPTDFAEMRSMRHLFGAARPKVLVELAAMKGLSHRFGLGPQAAIEIANLSSHPQLTGKPTRVAVVAPESSVEMAAMLNLHREGDHHELRFKAAGISLPRALEPSFARTELTCEQGKLNVVGKGWGDSSQFEMQLKLDARELRARLPAAGSAFGLTAETWNQGLGQIDRLEAQAVMFGNWTSPRIRLDGKQLTSQFRRQVQASGDAALAARIDEQLGQRAAMEPPQQFAANLPTYAAPAAAAAVKEEPAPVAATPPAIASSPLVEPAAAPAAVAASPRENSEVRPQYMNVERRRPGEPSSPVATTGAHDNVLPPPAIAASESRPSFTGAASAMLPATVDNIAAASPAAARTATETTPAAPAAAMQSTASSAPVQQRYVPKLQYPESLRTVSAETPVEVATETATAASPAETTPAASAEGETQIAGTTTTAPASAPASDKVPGESLPDNVIVESKAKYVRALPPPAGFELGYDARKAKDAEKPRQDTPAAIAATPAEVTIERLPGSGPPPRTTTESSRTASIPAFKSAPAASSPKTTLPAEAAEQTAATDAPAAASDSRVGNWSKAFVKRIKGFTPKREAKPTATTTASAAPASEPVLEDDAAAIVSDEPTSPLNSPAQRSTNVQASATEPTATTAGSDAPAAPWYRRFWR